MSHNVAAARLWCLLSAFCFCLGSTPSHGAPLGISIDIDYDLSGMVVEQGTGRPVDGAYVVVTYRLPGDARNPRYGPDGECRKAKGAYTDADGRFRIPAERIDGLVMQFVRATKPGYYIANVQSPATTRQQLKTTPQLRLELVRRVPTGVAIPDSRIHTLDQYYSRISQYDLDCWRARYREDAAPAIPFLRIVQRETIKYKGFKSTFGQIERDIYLLESLPSRKTTTEAR